VGFYGLDIYSLFESIDAVLKHLRKVDPDLARYAQAKYEAFEPYQRDERAYVKSLFLGMSEDLQKEVTDILQELLEVTLNGLREHEIELFSAIQNARVVKNAEHYYRTMVTKDEDSWNIRDRHMMEILNILLKRFGKDSKGIVWAHNTHIGDYRATSMKAEGQINIGGLAREEWGFDNVSLVGFGTNQGTVVASNAWEGPTAVMTVPSGVEGSYEAAFHAVAKDEKLDSFWIDVGDDRSRGGPLAETHGHRAIGVVYHPAFERYGNYVPTSLANRYNAFIFVDSTSALRHLPQKFKEEEIPETWPKGE
jgi:erythromycin esterase-like protein